MWRRLRDLQLLERRSVAHHLEGLLELVVIEDPPAKPGTMGSTNPRGIAVFTAESHGVTVEVFDLKGTRTLAWSSDLWSWRQ